MCLVKTPTWSTRAQNCSSEAAAEEEQRQELVLRRTGRVRNRPSIYLVSHARGQQQGHPLTEGT